MAHPSLLRPPLLILAPPHPQPQVPLLGPMIRDPMVMGMTTMTTATMETMVTMAKMGVATYLSQPRLRHLQLVETVELAGVQYHYRLHRAQRVLLPVHQANQPDQETAMEMEVETEMEMEAEETTAIKEVQHQQAPQRPLRS